jgi:hypothetical protein
MLQPKEKLAGLRIRAGLSPFVASRILMMRIAIVLGREGETVRAIA